MFHEFRLLSHRFCYWLLWTEFLCVARELQGVHFGNHRISCLILVLLTSSQDLWHGVLGQFAAKCEAAIARISASKLEAMVLIQKKGWLSPFGLVEET